MIAPSSQAARRQSACPCATARHMQPQVLHHHRTTINNPGSTSASSSIPRLSLASGRDGVACRSSSISSLRTLQDTRHEALSPSRNWFVESVPSIVSRLAGGTSSLHVVHSRSEGAPQVFHSDLTAHETPAQSWQQCSTRVRQEHADGVVLIQPINSSNLDYCPLQAGSAVQLDRPASPQALSADSPTASPQRQALQRQARSESLNGGSHTTSYYGVVVTTVKSGSEACGACPMSNSGMDGMPTGGCDGCYVLKLCKSPGLEPGSPGCTHYTLTRVCQGRPLDQQLWEPWLSSQ